MKFKNLLLPCALSIQPIIAQTAIATNNDWQLNHESNNYELQCSSDLTLAISSDLDSQVIQVLMQNLNCDSDTTESLKGQNSAFSGINTVISNDSGKALVSLEPEHTLENDEQVEIEKVSTANFGVKADDYSRLGTYSILPQSERIAGSGLGVVREFAPDGVGAQNESGTQSKVLTCELIDGEWYALSLTSESSIETSQQQQTWTESEIHTSTKWVSSRTADYQRQNIMGRYTCKDLMDSVFSQALRGYSTDDFQYWPEETESNQYNLFASPNTVFEQRWILASITELDKESVGLSLSTKVPEEEQRVIELRFNNSEFYPLSIAERKVMDSTLEIPSSSD